MFSLRNRFGIPGVISVIALVFAMFGGAYAANHSSGGGKATASAKAKKGPRGPKGATGPAGLAGTAGAQGLPGPAGANGKDGSNGTNGAAGTSVTTTPVGPFEDCGDEEGVILHSASGNSTICNGAAGADGQTGFTESLPPGKTETGVWTIAGTEELAKAGSGSLVTSPSFNIPLASVPTAHFESEPGFASNCPGSTEKPTAASGHLCVYGFVFGLSFGGFNARRSGFVLFANFEESESGLHVGEGSWAVTG